MAGMVLTGDWGEAPPVLYAPWEGFEALVSTSGQTGRLVWLVEGCKDATLSVSLRGPLVCGEQLSDGFLASSSGPPAFRNK